ncbi:nuclear transport factor 2 family protein [Novosphingobium sp.]|uniref:nuclear transport factor 2 family protein n=1 Tax=Novosphingobium sp. TaxID=1874826 RepID=UPI00262AC685|nr:nuclear transport factor 2 family protein [Novosphingobium sp.]
MTASLEQRLETLETRQALLDLTSDYCHGFDKRDFDRFLAIWWDDAVWEIGPPFGSFTGHEGITHAVHDILWPAWAMSTHYTTNLHVTADGADSANGVCDVYCIGNTSDGQAQTVAATYRDHFVRRDGIWKIARRTVTMQHFSPLTGITLSAPQ